MNNKEVQEYEHSWNGMNLCKKHDRIRCDECSYVQELKETMETLRKQLKGAEKSINKAIDELYGDSMLFRENTGDLLSQALSRIQGKEGKP